MDSYSYFGRYFFVEHFHLMKKITQRVIYLFFYEILKKNLPKAPYTYQHSEFEIKQGTLSIENNKIGL